MRERRRYFPSRAGTLHLPRAGIRSVRSLARIGALGAALLAVGSPLSARADGLVAEHRVDIDIRGPLARIVIERPLAFGPEYGRKVSDEAVVDLDLPEGGVLTSLSVEHDDRLLRLAPRGDVGAAEKAYLVQRQRAGWRRSSVPIDEGADLRLRVAAPKLGEREAGLDWTLRYEIVAPLSCRDGAFGLEIPALLDPGPTPADVRVRARLPLAPGSVESWQIGEVDLPPAKTGIWAARARVPTLSPWHIRWKLRPTASGQEARAPRAALLSAWVPGLGKDPGRLATLLCRPSAVPAKATPAEVAVFLDRSSSVGPGGAAVERDLAGALLLGLPPGLVFNAFFYDREVEPLFPLARSATHEALGQLSSKMGLGSLRNGSQLSKAFEAAVRSLGRAEDSDGRKGPADRRYWFVLTDGALPDDQTRGALLTATRRLDPREVEVGVFVVRPDGDERIATADRQALAAIVARLGGVVREISSSQASEAAPAILSSLAAGGDLVDAQLSAAGLRPAGLDPVGIAAGQGGFVVIKAPRRPPSVEVRAAFAGRSVRFRTPVFSLPGKGGGVGWGASARPATMTGTREEAVALVAPPAATGAEGAGQGDMDREVVHKALAYSFLPRARACYLGRQVRRSGDYELQGRVRLELHLERGEMMDAEVTRSTLGRPEIESCLHEAAYAVRIPRAFNKDAPVVAALNLVFRPWSARRNPDPQSLGDTPLDREIARILAPTGLGSGSDPMELLIEETTGRPVD